MSVQAIAWVLEQSKAELADRLVLLAIANHADSTGGNAWPAVATIAREARVSHATVCRALATLVELGELSVAHRASKDRTNLYQIHTSQYEMSDISSARVRHRIHANRALYQTVMNRADASLREPSEDPRLLSEQDRERGRAAAAAAKAALTNRPGPAGPGPDPQPAQEAVNQ